MDGSDKKSWNNQIEEITFSYAAETWLADDIFDRLDPDDKFPSVDRIRKIYGVKGDFAKSLAKIWRVRPFRDVLPTVWFASLSCYVGTGKTASNK